MQNKGGNVGRQVEIWGIWALPLSVALKQVKLKVLIKTGTVGKQIKIKSRSPKLVGAKVQ